VNAPAAILKSGAPAPDASKLLDEWSEAPLQDRLCSELWCFDALFETSATDDAGDSSVQTGDRRCNGSHMHWFTADGERILSVHSAAIRLGVADRTVRLWARQGRLPGFKDGPKIWRFRETDVEAVRVRLASERREARSAAGDSHDDS
jgi:excisionase family DNA binding protein